VVDSPSAPPDETTAIDSKGGASSGGGGYNCNRDKTVDSPAKIASLVADSPYRLHVTSSGGSDASGTVTVSGYTFTDDHGGVVSVTPAGQGCSYGDNPNDLSVEQFSPGTHYRVVATSHDACNNTASSAAVDVTTPPASADTKPPTVSAPFGLNAAGFGGPVPSLAVYVVDDQATDHVDVYVNGTLSDIFWATDHQWSDPRGELYWGYTDFHAGESAQIEVRAYDRAGNMTSSAGTVSW
jgi:hypothetical protein